MNKYSSAGLDNSSDPKRKLATGIIALLLIFAIGFALDAASCAMDGAGSREETPAEEGRRDEGVQRGRADSDSKGKSDGASEAGGFTEDELVRLGRDIRVAGFSKLSALGPNRSSLGDALPDALSEMGFEPDEVVLVCARDAEVDQAHMTAWFEVAGASTYLKCDLIGADAWKIVEVEDVNSESDPPAAASAETDDGKGAEGEQPEKGIDADTGR